MITDEQVTQFIEDGVAIVDDLVPMPVIADAAASFDAVYDEHPEQSTGILGYVTGPGLDALYQHENLELAARKILDTEQVNFMGAASLHTTPQEGPWSYNPVYEHVDVQFNLDEWTSSPRRIYVMFMFFLDDITAERAPTMVRPGSHMTIARHLGSRPAYRSGAAYLRGLADIDPMYMEFAQPLGDLSEDDFSPLVPLTGKKGQVAISTTALIHTGSRNATDKARKMLFVTFVPAGVDLRFREADAPSNLAYLEGLQQRFAPDRRHLVESVIAGLKGDGQA